MQKVRNPMESWFLKFKWQPFQLYRNRLIPNCTINERAAACRARAKPSRSAGEGRRCDIEIMKTKSKNPYIQFINHRFFKVLRRPRTVDSTAHTTHERAHTPRTYNASTPNPSLLPIHAGCVPACLFGARVVQRGAALKRCVGRRVSPRVRSSTTRALPTHVPPPLVHRPTSNL